MNASGKTLVLASGNEGKLRELDALLHPLGYNLKPQADWNTPEADENGMTFLENALIKARNAAAHTGQAAIADDSGLVVPSLEGAPGIHSARYSHEGTDAANNAQLLDEMNSMGGEQRAAHFYCAIVMLESARDPAPRVATASWQGRILMAPRGTNGFGYDPLFFVPEYECASAELDPGTKRLISHRGQAVTALIRMLKDA